MITPTQSKMARIALGWSMDDAAQASGLGKNTVMRFENDGNPSLSTVRTLESAYRAAGVVFGADGSVRPPKE